MTRRVITVFGGAGFIGRHVVRRLAKADWVVRVACRHVDEALYLKPMGTPGQILPWGADITDRSSVHAALNGAEAAINLVGVLTGPFDKVHVEGARNVAEVAAELGLRQVVHVSALGADETSRSAYARSKAEGEAAVRDAFPDAVILRPSVVFGSLDKFFNRFASIARFSPALPVIGAPAFPKVSFGGDGERGIDLFGDGGPKMQPVWVGDLAEAAVRGLTDKAMRGNTYELGGPNVYSFKELMELTLKHTRRKRMLLPLPYGLASFEAWFLEKLPKPLLTRDQVILLRQDNVVSEGARGFADIGIEPATVEAILPTYLHRFYTPEARERIKEELRP